MPSQLAGARRRQANALSPAGSGACLVRQHGFGIAVWGCERRTSAEQAERAVFPKQQVYLLPASEGEGLTVLMC